MQAAIEWVAQLVLREPVALALGLAFGGALLALLIWAARSPAGVLNAIAALRTRQVASAVAYGPQPRQLLWVHAPLGLAVAITSEVSAASNARGQAVALARGPLFRAVMRRAAQADQR